MNAPHFIPDRKTPVDIRAMFNALSKAWIAQFGSPGAYSSLLIFLAHWALETGRGRSMHCYNLGNIKGKADGKDGRSWTYFRCNEIIGTRVVWFDPPDPGCCFRAYETLAEGVADYLATIRRNFDAAWPALLAGDPAEFSRQLKLHHYYTAVESQYTHALVAIYHQLDAELSSVDLSTPNAVAHALDRLGYVVNDLDRATRAFQTDRGLKVDGIVGPRTKAALILALQQTGA